MPAGQRVMRGVAKMVALGSPHALARWARLAFASAFARQVTLVLAFALGVWQPAAHAHSRVTIIVPSPDEPQVYQHALHPISLDPKQAIQFAEQLVDLINRLRADEGLPPLRWAGELRALAAAHSQKMARRDAISHEGFAQRFATTASRLCVENVGARFRDPASQLDGWRASPLHQRNLLDPEIRRVGIANTRGYVTYFACR